jgi:putative ABC transport system ATP-binding protein
MIKVTHLTKIYQTGEVEVRALDNVSFQVKKGEFLAIMGPSGSGKSTLMNLLGALDVPTSGEYVLAGEKIAELNEDELADIRNRKIGFVFQSYNLLPRITALRNVMVPMMYGGFSKEDRVERAQKYLKMVGLEDRILHTPSQLSGGQQQRVAIARALSMEPSIILADEPTGNIATKQAIQIMKILDDFNQKGQTVLVITHENEIAECAKRIIYLRDGKIIKDKLNRHRRDLSKITK